jgi:hypothetical protein
MAVQVLAGPVVTHGGAWVRVTGSDLDIAQIHARVKTAISGSRRGR